MFDVYNLDSIDIYNFRNKSKKKFSHSELVSSNDIEILNRIVKSIIKYKFGDSEILLTDEKIFSRMQNILILLFYFSSHLLSPSSFIFFALFPY